MTKNKYKYYCNKHRLHLVCEDCGFDIKFDKHFDLMFDKHFDLMFDKHFDLFIKKMINHKGRLNVNEKK